MRIAVSDYDGTLNVDGTVSDQNIAAIKAWRKAGHLFGIATGRDLSLIMHDVQRWGIPFDFLVCVNGAMLYDGGQHLLRRISIPDALIKAILLHPATRSSLHIELCTNGKNKVHVSSEQSWFRRIDAEFEEIAYDEALMQKDIQQVSLAYSFEDDYINAVSMLAAEFKDALSLNLNNTCIDINNAGVNKLSGLLDMLRIQEWLNSELLVIGDGENDIPMISHFGGFSMTHAPGKVTGHACAIYRSVAEMLTAHI